MKNKLLTLTNGILSAFTTDLTCDVNSLKGYKGDFLYAFRESGTNLFKLDFKIINYNCSDAELSKYLEDAKTYLVGNNKHFYFFDGEDFEELEKVAFESIFDEAAIKIKKTKEEISKLDIEVLAKELLELMNLRRTWRNKIYNSNVSEFRRIRNYFEVSKIKKVTSIDDAKNELYKNLYMLND